MYSVKRIDERRVRLTFLKEIEDTTGDERAQVIISLSIVCVCVALAKCGQCVAQQFDPKLFEYAKDVSPAAAAAAGARNLIICCLCVWRSDEDDWSWCADLFFVHREDLLSLF